MENTTFVVYVLQSVKSGRLYIGYTHNIERRLIEHNSGQTASTRNKGPWELLIAEQVSTKEEAMILERKLKSWKSKRRVLTWIERQKI